MAKKIVLKLIKFYQKTLSPDHGWFKHRYSRGFCQFTPSCSMYCLQAVQKYGAMQGLWKGLWRVMRCNPWSKGGEDPVK